MNKKAFVTAITVAVGLVAVLGTEAALRYRESRRANEPGPVPYQMYYRHRRLERALVRNADYFGRIHINRYGFRGPEPSVKKMPGTTRILAVGLSSTFSPCAKSDSDTWPARLQHWLGALAPGQRFEVINAGVPGATLLDFIVRMQSELFAFSPDVVVLYSGHGVVGQDNLLPTASELALNPTSDTPDEMPVVTPWGEWLSRNSLLYFKLQARWQARRNRSRGGTPVLDRSRWEDAMARATFRFRHDLRGLVLVSHGIGARVAMVEATYFTGSKPAKDLSESEKAIWSGALGGPAELILEGYRRFANVSRTVADSLGATFVPTADWVPGSANYCAGNPIHFNNAGADVMARRLAAALLASKALAARPGAVSE